MPARGEESGEWSEESGEKEDEEEATRNDACGAHSYTDLASEARSALDDVCRCLRCHFCSLFSVVSPVSPF